MERERKTIVVFHDTKANKAGNTARIRVTARMRVTASHVICGWARAIFVVINLTKAFEREQ